MLRGGEERPKDEVDDCGGGLFDSRLELGESIRCWLSPYDQSCSPMIRSGIGALHMRSC